MNQVYYLLANTFKELQETHETWLPLQKHAASATTHPLCSSLVNLPTWPYEIQNEGLFTRNIRKAAVPIMGFKGIRKVESKRWSHHPSWEAGLFLSPKVQKKKSKVAEGKEELSCSLHTPSRNKYQLCCADPRCQNQKLQQFSCSLVRNNLEDDRRKISIFTPW